MAWYNPSTWFSSSKKQEVGTRTLEGAGDRSPAENIARVESGSNYSPAQNIKVTTGGGGSGGGSGGGGGGKSRKDGEVLVSAKQKKDTPIDASFTSQGQTYNPATKTTEISEAPKQVLGYGGVTSQSDKQAVDALFIRERTEKQKLIDKNKGKSGEYGMPTITKDKSEELKTKGYSKPYWEIVGGGTPSENIEQSKYSSDIKLAVNPLGYETVGTFDTNWANIITAQKIYTAEKSYKDAQSSIKKNFDINPKAYIDAPGYNETITETPEGVTTTYSLGEEYFTSTPEYKRYYGMLDDKGILKDDIYKESVKEARERRSVSTSLNTQLKTGSVAFTIPSIATGLLEFIPNYASNYGTQLVEDGQGFSSGEKFKFSEDSFFGKIRAVPESPNISGFNIKDISTYKNIGSYLKELPERPGAATRIVLSTAAVAYTLGSGYSLYSAERAGGATKFGATGTVFGEGLSMFAPIKIKSGVVGTLYAEGATTQFGPGQTDLLELGKLGSGGKLYTASGGSTYTTPAEFSYGSVKYGWTGATPSINTISGTNLQYVTLTGGSNFFEAKPGTGISSEIYGAGGRKILNIKNIPVQDSRYTFTFDKQVSLSEEVFKGWGTGVKTPTGFTISSGNFYFTPKTTATLTEGGISLSTDAPILSSGTGLSISKNLKPFSINNVNIIPGKSSSFLINEEEGIFTKTNTRIISKNNAFGSMDSFKSYDYGGGYGLKQTKFEVTKTLSDSVTSVTAPSSISPPSISTTGLNINSLSGATGLYSVSLSSPTGVSSSLFTSPAATQSSSQKVTQNQMSNLATNYEVMSAVTPMVTPSVSVGSKSASQTKIPYSTITTIQQPTITPVAQVFAPRPPKVKTPPIETPFGGLVLPPLWIPGGEMSDKLGSRRYKGIQAKKYTPSYEAFLGIKKGSVKKGSMFTGLETRGIPKGFSFATRIGKINFGNIFKTKRKRRKNK